MKEYTSSPPAARLGDPLDAEQMKKKRGERSDKGAKMRPRKMLITQERRKQTPPGPRRRWTCLRAVRRAAQFPKSRHPLLVSRKGESAPFHAMRQGGGGGRATMVEEKEEKEEEEQEEPEKGGWMDLRIPTKE